jgi:hypothetical protein
VVRAFLTILVLGDSGSQIDLSPFTEVARTQLRCFQVCLWLESAITNNHFAVYRRGAILNAKISLGVCPPCFPEACSYQCRGDCCRGHSRRATIRKFSSECGGSFGGRGLIKSLGFEYVAANPGSSYRSLHESTIKYGGTAETTARSF